jgi:hypothetical protein
VNTPIKLTSRIVLDSAVDHGCAVPGCGCKEDMMFIHSACHPEYPVEVGYVTDQGALVVRCMFCKQVVIAVGVEKVV